jgi:hypothetical protein
MSKLEPQIAIRDIDHLERQCDQLWATASHLWFPGQPKHAYDNYAATNRIAFEKHQDVPGELDQDALYYSNPLSRIVALHQSARDLLTGATYHSPWPRQDAPWR